MLGVLARVERERHISICPFGTTSFAETLRERLCWVFELAVRAYTLRIARENAIHLLHSGAPLSPDDVRALKELALDEYEQKRPRKDALLRLAGSRCMMTDEAIDLVCSAEEGVARLAVDLLAGLVPAESCDQAFLDRCVVEAGAIDDVGVKRRLVNVILDVDLGMGMRALRLLPVDETGTRRRVALQLCTRERSIVESGLQEEALALARRCEGGISGQAWRDELGELERRLEACRDAGT